MINIGTWNVRSLYQTGKPDNVIAEAKRLKIDVLGLSEVRWCGRDRIRKDKYKLIYSGGDRHEYGVGVLIRKNLSGMVTEVLPLSDRVIAICLNAKPKPITVIQVYAPTSESEDEEIERVYEDIEKAIKKIGKSNLVFVIGDFNAKVGRNTSGSSVVGPFGLGLQNEQSAHLVEFSDKNNMVICNTWFQHHVRKQYTWRSPGDQTRNQIDYIMVNARYRNTIVNCRALTSADCNSDHQLLAARCRLRLKNYKYPKK